MSNYSVSDQPGYPPREPQPEDDLGLEDWL